MTKKTSLAPAYESPISSTTPSNKTTEVYYFTHYLLIDVETSIQTHKDTCL